MADLAAADLVTCTQPTIYGRAFRCSRRTDAHLAHTRARLAREHPGARLLIIQGCFNTTVAASVGTHDKDACLDVQVVGLSWPDSQRFLRECGWAAWWRYPPAFGHHIHMVSIGYPGGPAAVGIYVPAQVDDYYRHAMGLKGQHDSGDDPSWHPDDINATVFDFEAWEQELEDNMPLNDADLAKIRTVVREEIAAELDTPAEVKRGDRTITRSLRQQVKELFQR